MLRWRRPCRSKSALCRHRANYLGFSKKPLTSWGTKVRLGGEGGRALATQVYGADGVDYAPEAKRNSKLFSDLGYGHLPICMAKTHLSLSHEAQWKGVPQNYVFPIRDIRLSAGAGFLYPLAGDMQTMPGLSSEPAATRIDIDEEGRILGLF